MSQKPKIAFIMDPISHIAPKKDTTLGLMQSAKKMSADLYYLGQDDLHVKNGHVYGEMAQIDVFEDENNFYEIRFEDCS